MRKLFSALLILIFISSVSAFSADLEVVDRTSSQGDPAVLNLSITNEYSSTDRFRISSINAPPSVAGWFEYDYSKNIEPGETKNFLIRVEHRENIVQQNYGFTLNLRSFNHGELKKVDDYFTVDNPYDMEITSFQTNGNSFKPGETINIDLSVKNTAELSLENFSAAVEFLDRRETREGSGLGPGNQVTYSFSIQIPNKSAPGPKELRATAYRSGEEENSVSQTVNISEVRRIDRSVERIDRVLRDRVGVTVQNNGNVKDTVEIERSIPVYMEPLVSPSPEPDRIESSGSQVTFHWVEEMEPGESIEVGYGADYRPLLIFLGLFAVGVFGLKKLQTDVKISKEAERRGGEIDVLIQVENNSGVSRENISIKDFVPDIAEVDPEFEMGRPVKTKTRNGTRLEWEIEGLDPGEQRVLKYTIHPLVEVEGGAVLPPVEILQDGNKLKETSRVEVEFQP